MTFLKLRPADNSLPCVPVCHQRASIGHKADCCHCVQLQSSINALSSALTEPTSDGQRRLVAHFHAPSSTPRPTGYTFRPPCRPGAHQATLESNLLVYCNNDRSIDAASPRLAHIVCSISNSGRRPARRVARPFSTHACLAVRILAVLHTPC